MKTLHAIKIDVEKQQVYAVSIPNTLQDIYQAIDCQTIDFVRECTLRKEDLIVDDEALLQEPQPLSFEINGRVLTGNALVVGVDLKEGETTDCLSSVEEIQAQVRFSAQLHRNPFIVFVGFTDLDISA